MRKNNNYKYLTCNICNITRKTQEEILNHVDNCHQNEMFLRDKDRYILKILHGKNDRENKKYEKIYGGI